MLEKLLWGPKEIVPDPVPLPLNRVTIIMGGDQDGNNDKRDKGDKGGGGNEGGGHH